MKNEKINLLIEDYNNKHYIFIINKEDLSFSLEHPVFHNLESSKNQNAALAYLNLSSHQKKTHQMKILENGFIFFDMPNNNIHNFSNIDMNHFTHLNIVNYNDNEIEQFIETLNKHNYTIKKENLVKTKTRKNKI